MAIPVKEIFDRLPAERKKRIDREAKKLIKEYKGLQEFRKDLGLTQEQLAGQMKISQVNISRLESRDDMHLSTLRKYVEALGCNLEINIRIPDQSVVRISHLLRN